MSSTLYIALIIMSAKIRKNEDFTQNLHTKKNPQFFAGFFCMIYNLFYYYKNIENPNPRVIPLFLRTNFLSSEYFKFEPPYATPKPKATLLLIK